MICMMQKAEFPTGGIVRDPPWAADLVTGSIRNSRTDSKVWMREEHACFYVLSAPGIFPGAFCVHQERGIFFKKKDTVQCLQKKKRRNKV